MILLKNNKTIDDYRRNTLKIAKTGGVSTALLLILAIVSIVLAYNGIVTSPVAIINTIVAFLGAIYTGKITADKIDLILKIDERLIENQLHEEYAKAQEKQHERKNAPIYMIYEREDDHGNIQKIPVKDDEMAYFPMEISDFYEMEEFNIDGIKLDQIDEYLLEHKLDLTELCELISLSREETMLVYLEYAKRYYMQGDMNLGDRFLNEVDECNDKTDYVKYVVEEIKSKRKFYQHRNAGNIKTLSLEKRFKINSLKNSKEGTKF